LYINNLIRQHKFLSEIGKQLTARSNGPIEQVEKLRAALTQPKNMAVHIAVNLNNFSSFVSDPVAPWKTFLPENLSSSINK